MNKTSEKIEKLDDFDWTLFISYVLFAVAFIIPALPALLVLIADALH